MIETLPCEPPAREPLLRCERLVVGWGGRPLLPPIDFEVRPGSFAAVLGRNGSGKSTFLKTLLGLVPPISGEVRRSSPRLRAAYVPQTRELDVHLPLRVRELVAWGRLSRWGFLGPWAPRAERAAVEAALDEAGALDLADRFVRELSEGQKQRALFARVLASEAQLVLLDEPTAAMDRVAEREAIERLHRLAHERGTAVLVVTHSLSAASRLADGALFLDPDAGEVVAGSRCAVFAHPAFRNRFGEMEVAHDC
jgi:zinc transport system ATP-binding protein